MLTFGVLTCLNKENLNPDNYSKISTFLEKALLSEKFRIGENGNKNYYLGEEVFRFSEQLSKVVVESLVCLSKQNPKLIYYSHIESQLQNGKDVELNRSKIDIKNYKNLVNLSLEWQKKNNMKIINLPDLKKLEISNTFTPKSIIKK